MAGQRTALMVKLGKFGTVDMLAGSVMRNFCLLVMQFRTNIYK